MQVHHFQFKGGKRDSPFNIQHCQAYTHACRDVWKKIQKICTKIRNSIWISLLGFSCAISSPIFQSETPYSEPQICAIWNAVYRNGFFWWYPSAEQQSKYCKILTWYDLISRGSASLQHPYPPTQRYTNMRWRWSYGGWL